MARDLRVSKKLGKDFAKLHVMRALAQFPRLVHATLQLPDVGLNVHRSDDGRPIAEQHLADRRDDLAFGHAGTHRPGLQQDITRLWRHSRRRKERVRGQGSTERGGSGKELATFHVLIRPDRDTSGNP